MKKLLLLLVPVLMVVISSCKKDKETPAPANNYTPTVYFFKATKASGGEILVADTMVSVEYTPTGSLTTNNTFCTSRGTLAIVTDNGSGGYNFDYIATVGYGKNDGYPANSTDAYNYFPIGAGTFGDTDATLSGFVITYKDASNVEWRSDIGTGDQTGSSINITSKADYNASGLVYGAAGTFNCILYDGSGNSMTLTNGTFNLPYSY